MPKYKIKIDLDLDFESIFAEIPEQYDASSLDSLDDYYKEVIYGLLRKIYEDALYTKIDALNRDKADGMYKYLKPHIECEIMAAKQIAENSKVTKKK
jgi:hypothetical protein